MATPPLSALRLSAAELLRRPGAERLVDVTVPLADLGVVDDERFDPDATVEIRLLLESLNDGIVVDGLLHTPWRGTCRRCLEPATGVVESAVHELYQRVLTDPEAFQLEGDQLDLRPLVRELVLLDAPDAPLCTPDCAGLCPTCGVNLNHATCDCATPPADPRWSALAELDGLDLPPG